MLDLFKKLMYYTRINNLCNPIILGINIMNETIFPPKYRADLAKQNLKSNGIICDNHEEIWVGAEDTISWSEKELEDRHPESEDSGYVDIEDGTWNIVVNVNGRDTYFRTIDLDW